MCWFLPQVPTLAGAGMPKFRSQEKTTEVSHVGRRHQVLEPSLVVPQGLHWQEAGIRRQGQELNPGTPIWDTGVLTRVNY